MVDSIVVTFPYGYSFDRVFRMILLIINHYFPSEANQIISLLLLELQLY